MDETTALHTAARRYCEARFSEWVQVYADLQHKETWQIESTFKPGWDYSEEAYRTFPRYRAAKNTLIEIERLAVDSRMSLAEMRKFLIAASTKAEAELQTEFTNKVAHAAVCEEAEDFRVYVEALTPTDLVQIEPLPHRRVLSKEESERLWNGLRRAWSSIGDGYWFPLKGGYGLRTFWPFTLTIFRASTVSASSGMLWRDAVSRQSSCFMSLATQSMKSNSRSLSRVIVTAENSIQPPKTQTGSSTYLMNLRLPSAVNG